MTHPSGTLLVLSAVLFASGGCSTPPPVASAATGPNTLTHGQVQLTLRTGVTTQQEVIDAFGAPNITTLDSEGREVWTYRRHASVQRVAGDSSYFNVLVYGSGSESASASSSSQSMTLIIKFDASKHVTDFRSMSSSF